MLTQCPYCLTIFRVGPEHLKAAAGRVRCCRCHQVFNALQRLEESPTFFSNPPLEKEKPATNESLSGNGLETSTEPYGGNQEEKADNDWSDPGADSPGNEFKPMLPDLDSAQEPGEAREGILEQDDGLEPEPDYFAEGTESQMSELLDQDSSSILLPDSEEPPAEPAQDNDDNIVALNASDETPAATEEAREFEESILKDEAVDERLGKPDYDSVPAFRVVTEPSPQPFDNEDRALSFTAEKTSVRRRKVGLLWVVGSLLLLLPLAGQLAWQFRDNLIQHETGRQTLNLLCSVAGCEVPQRRAVDKIVIQGRNLSSHSDRPGILFMQLRIVNTAAFDQPFPRLTLSLYNDKGNLIARRTFEAEDYLSPKDKQLKLMPKAQPILVEMELVDPGKEVTGFSFDFL